MWISLIEYLKNISNVFAYSTLFELALHVSLISHKGINTWGQFRGLDKKMRLMIIFSLLQYKRYYSLCLLKKKIVFSFSIFSEHWKYFKFLLETIETFTCIITLTTSFSSPVKESSAIKVAYPLFLCWVKLAFDSSDYMIIESDSGSKRYVSFAFPFVYCCLCCCKCIKTGCWCKELNSDCQMGRASLLAADAIFTLNLSSVDFSL